MNNFSTISRFTFPEFIRTSYPRFIEFIEAYYKFLEQKGNYGYFLSNYLRNLDIDTADEEYLDAYINEYSEFFPKNTLVDKNILIRALHEFYLSKGSEDSIRFLFRILYGVEIDIYIPNKHILRCSNGTYTNKTYCYISSENYFKIQNRLSEDSYIELFGTLSNARAIINKVEQIIYTSTQSFLKLDISSYDKDFEPNEKVVFKVNDYEVTENIYGLIQSIRIDNPGYGYSKKSKVTISGTSFTPASIKISNTSKGGITNYNITTLGNGETDFEEILLDKTSYDVGCGFNAILRVDDGVIKYIDILGRGYGFDVIPLVLTTSGNSHIELVSYEIGQIKNIIIDDPGIGYDEVDISVSGGTGAILTPIIGCIFNTPKAYTSTTGFLSNTDKLQDSFYYQQFSYDIKSEIPVSVWKNAIKTNYHPSGYELFGSIVIDQQIYSLIELEESEFFKVELPFETNTLVYEDIINITDIRLLYENQTCMNAYGLDNLEFLVSQEWFEDYASKYYDYSINDLVCSNIMINATTTEILQTVI